MPSCNVCPFNCNVDRIKNFGVCGLPNKILVSHVQQHFFEEPFISGAGGSGAIFFTGCNGRCVFCQNYKISQPEYWRIGGLDDERKTATDLELPKISNLVGFFKHSNSVCELELLKICHELIAKKVHNINFVSPTPYTELFCDFLRKYKKDIPVPIIWNSNGYEKSESIEKLIGLIDVYLPDFKYFDDKIAVRYSMMPNYFKYASGAISEMFKQVGYPSFSKNGMIKKGLVIRHLVLPGNLEDSKKILSWIFKTFGKKAYVSLMSQYYPTYKASKSNSKFTEINRTLSADEHKEITDYFINLGFEDGLIQDLESADPAFTPDF